MVGVVKIEIVLFVLLLANGTIHSRFIKIFIWLAFIENHRTLTC